MSSTNIYINLIKQLSYNNKYTKWYCSIIENSLLRATSRKSANMILGYSEEHHIIPKCFFSKQDAIFNTSPNIKENKTFLSAKEHFLCHWLLTKMLINQKHCNKMKYAFAAFQLNSKGNRILTSAQYNRVRRENALIVKNKVEQGLHYFQSEKSKNATKVWIKEKLEAKEHHMQQQEYKDLHRDRNLKLSEQGLHPFQDESFIKRNAERASKRNKKLVEDNNHIFQNNEMKKKALTNTLKTNKKLVETGSHYFQSKESKKLRLERNKNDNPSHKMFLSIISSKKTYSKGHLSTWFPEFKKYY